MRKHGAPRKMVVLEHTLGQRDPDALASEWSLSPQNKLFFLFLLLMRLANHSCMRNQLPKILYLMNVPSHSNHYLQSYSVYRP